MTAARTPDSPALPRGRLALALWVAGMVGVVVIVLASIPNLPELPPEIPLSAVIVGAVVQSGVLLALVCWVGAVLAPRVGLRAPAFEALVRRDRTRSATAALRGQLVPGLLGGLGAGLALVAFGAIAPTALAEAAPLPLAARVLYGGITEELLLRWGVMTLLVWGLWRTVQRGRGAPTSFVLWLGIVIAAVTFGLGHLPAASMITPLTTPIVAYIVLANAAVGILFGWLYWRWGLEAAMLAHGLAHVVAQALAMLATATAA